MPKTWQQVQAVTKFLKGKKIKGQNAYGYLDAPKPWGGFGFYFLGSRATAYAKHPDDKAWLFDVDTMKPRINNPAWVRAIQDVVDALPSEPADQLNADPNTTGFQQFLAGTGSMIPWWGDIGQVAKTSDTSVIGNVVGFDILPGSDDVYNAKTGQWDKLASGPNYAPNCAYLGWGIYVMARVDGDEKKHKAAWSAAAHLGGKDLSLWTVMYPSGFQVHRTSHSNIDEWVAAGYDKEYITSYLELAVQLLQPSQPGGRAAHSRHLPVLQRGRGRADEDLRRQGRCADGRQQHRRRMGEADRPDRPREADRTLQGLARRVGPYPLRLVPLPAPAETFTSDWTERPSGRVRS